MRRRCHNLFGPSTHRHEKTDGGVLAVRRVLRHLPRLTLDLLFPLNCLGCQREGKLLCETCVDRLPRLKNPYCRVCAQPNAGSICRWCQQATPGFDGLRGPYLMEGPIREAIHSLKYRGVRAAATELGVLLAQFLKDQPMPGDVIVPVPLHPRRFHERGYNQSTLLARQVAKLTGLSLSEGSLARTKDSPPQVLAGSREQRREYVAGSFQGNSDVHGRAVILVDDVATTGSTLSSCASTLKAAGATSVWGLVLAREG